MQAISVVCLTCGKALGVIGVEMKDKEITYDECDACIRERLSCRCEEQH